MKIHTRFNYLLEHYGWSQQDFSNKAHVSNTTISKWCSGKASPRLEKIPSLAKIFECNVVWLMTGHGLPFEKDNNTIQEEGLKWSVVGDENEADRIRKAIDKTGFSYRDLGAKFDVSHTTVNNWAKGRISKKHLEQLCEMAGVTVEWIKTGDKVDKSKPITQSEFEELANSLVTTLEAADDEERAALVYSIRKLINK
ncbi:helix-turn-helix transcriptional regulator [Catenovulum sediminis]|uniref:Helix-turn-helix transcriptional regulator n=1 Tax=Catenovulum sediminis TaxID=1740262 RepID=A0ABV1RKB9_9ALTE